MVQWLIVGGSLDGTWHEGDTDRPSIELVKRTPLPVSALVEAVSEPAPGHKRELYTRRTWRSDDREWVIWGEYGLSDADIFRRLLNHYRPPKAADEAGR